MYFCIVQYDFTTLLGFCERHIVLIAILHYKILERAKGSPFLTKKITLLEFSFSLMQAVCKADICKGIPPPKQHTIR